MKRYFKTEAGDWGHGPGIVYLEFEDEWPTRQVEIYRDHWLHSYQPSAGEPPENLCDQPMDELELGPDQEIGCAEFEAVWDEAVKHGGAQPRFPETN